MQNSVDVSNAMLDAWEAQIGPSPIIRFLSGAIPANCAAAETGTIACQAVLPSDWMANASGATKLKAGTWVGTATVSVQITHYRIYDSTGTTCKNQGSCAATGTPDMLIDNATPSIGQSINVVTFTLGAGNQ